MEKEKKKEEEEEQEKDGMEEENGELTHFNGVTVLVQFTADLTRIYTHF